jgi:hypothetical protein
MGNAKKMTSATGRNDPLTRWERSSCKSIQQSILIPLNMK